MRILELFNSKIGSIIISIVLALALASLFKRTCSDGQCVIIKGPPLKQVEGKIFSFDNKCYKYKAEASSCKAKGKVIKTK